MKLRLQLLFDSLRYSYITVPMALAVFGLLLAWGTLQLDMSSLNISDGDFGERTTAALKFGQGLLYSGGVDGARALLGAIAGSIISVAALASSIAITALALASGQFGSRLLRNFMDDRGFQITLGTFNGTFLFCLVILRATRSADEGGGGVPQVSISMALSLAVLCVFLLIYFLHHMARAIQAPFVVADAAHDLNQELDRLYAKSSQRKNPATPDRIKQIERAELPDWDAGLGIEASKNGYIKAVNYDRLLHIATARDSTFKLAFRAGKWVGAGDTLVAIWPPLSPVAYEDDVRECFILGRDRSAVQDPEYGINQLVEVASRALSPGINDPFTAMTCLDYLGASLNHVLRCDIPSPYLLDENDQLRIVINNVTFPGLCDASFNMIRHYGADSPAVMMRMLEVLAKVGAKCRTHAQSDSIALHARLVRDEALQNIRIDRDNRRHRRALHARFARRRLSQTTRQLTDSREITSQPFAWLAFSSENKGNCRRFLVEAQLRLH